MSQYLFPDNTVMCNFGAVDRLDLLESVLNGRGRWTAAVADEVRRSTSFVPPLARVADAGWMGDPVEVTADSEIRKVNRVRRAVFGGTDAEPLKHLGEAETCFVILEGDEFAGSWWISDDREALRYARFQQITTRETVDLMSIAVANGDVSEHDALALMDEMIDRGRSLRVPTSSSEFLR